MADLIGTFKNNGNNVEITFNPDKSFSLNGFFGQGTIIGRYWFEDSNIAGFPNYLALQRNDVSFIGVDRALINIVNENVFRVLDKQSSVVNDSSNIEIAVFTKITQK